MFAHGEGLTLTNKRSMKKIRFAVLAALIASIAVLVMAQSVPPKYSRVENVVYYKNPQTGRLGLYLSFELEPDHVYSFQYTRDGVTFFDAFQVNTKGATHETYESFNIGDPSQGIWPRILDLGMSP